MGILSHALEQDAKLVTATINEYGDQVPSEETTIKCRFRYITQLDKNVNSENVDAGNDAIIWFEPDADVVEGTIVKVDGVYWRIDRLIKARRLVGNTVHFLKAFVNRHQLGDFS